MKQIWKKVNDLMLLLADNTYYLLKYYCLLLVSIFISDLTFKREHAGLLLFSVVVFIELYGFVLKIIRNDRKKK